MTLGYRRHGIPAPFALPVGFAAFLAVGTAAAALHGRLTATGVLIACAAVAGVMSFAAEPAASVPLAGIGWLTVAGFSRPPYAQLRAAGPAAGHAAFVVGLTSLACAGLGLVFRWYVRRRTLVSMGTYTGLRARRSAAGGTQRDPAGVASHSGAAGRHGAASAPGGGWPGCCWPPRACRCSPTLLTLLRPHLNLADDLLIYLVAVVTITVLGGFWPAVLAAVAASLLLNWYFTEPLHTFTIQQPKELLALLLFVTVAVAVSSVVHLAAGRAVQAARAREEAASLLELAQTVLGGADSPAAVLEHLTTDPRRPGRAAGAGGRAVDPGRVQRRRGQPARGVPHRHPRRPDPAVSPGRRTRPPRPCSPGTPRRPPRPWTGSGCAPRPLRPRRSPRATGCGRRCWRRSATTCARRSRRSRPASAACGRPTWHGREADQADLLATIEENADRLDALIGNLLDMSRLHTGSLQPFLRPTAIDEVAPVALLGLEEPVRMEIAVPDGFPLVLADPGLLERVLANLFANALQHSPATARPPELQAQLAGDMVVLAVVDHGPGVPDEAKERIFEPFTRVGDRYPGVGLGLAVARGFAEAMGGRIVARDTPGGGLTVAITLPAAVSADKSALGTGS